MSTAPSPAQQLAQQNALARSLVLSNGVLMTQNIFSTTVTPANTSVLNVTPRNVGLIKGFWIEVTATVTNASGSGLTLTDFNAANVLSNVTFVDLQNNTRVNTSGWHLHFVMTAKGRRVFGASGPTDSPIKYGSNFNVIAATATVAASATGTITMKYYVPLAYSQQDLRGAVYANVVNASMNLQLTINPTVSVASGDSTAAIYTGNPATNTSTTVTVYQEYWDQIPQGKGGPVLPMQDLSTVYELKQTTVSGMVANQEFPIQYSNFRDYLSTFVVYYNGAARTAGTDINYISLQVANFTNIFKVDPFLLALKTRQTIGTDYPPGVYYIDTRDRPVATTQYGNMEIVLNPSTAGGTAYALVGYEDFGLQNVITTAGSLPG